MFVQEGVYFLFGPSSLCTCFCILSSNFIVHIVIPCTADSFCVQVKIHPMMYVALTYDHRLIDGREAVTFLRKIKAILEDPRVMLVDV